ncbi:hypothetical protein B0A48_09920 [Cryoendolithus antarcticus]|uniref:Abnormal eversion of vulva protein 20 n=1 Tax=Cryoendolithus antarcticus TaxID=1507870 RepID=A0A1V8T330_9PEZI|nr:hypothetical protein B0A48_09920 [Cryoendolithus antarcticus]
MLSTLRKARLKDKEMRILMLGLDNAGKTTIVKRIMNEDVNSVSPTLGFIIKTIDFDGYKLNISPGDVGGQKTLRTYWKNYFEKTDTLIWVVDATDRERLEDCRQELFGLLQQERLMGASLLVFKNKSDVSSSMTEDELRKGLRLDDIHTHKWKIMTCSAITAVAAPPNTTPKPPHATTQTPLLVTQSHSLDDFDDEDDLDPAAFLKSVRELSEKREREDRERYRKLEEEIEAGRRERLARKEERKRSVSPKKNEITRRELEQARETSRREETSTPTARPAQEEHPAALTPGSGSKAIMDGVPEFRGFGSIKRPSAPGTPTREARTELRESPTKPSSSAAMPSRTGTVKWQQRPTSRGVESRPTSSASAKSSEPIKRVEVEKPGASREQIAAQLGARDPAWFRQTADRGVGNAAFRKSKEEQGSEESVVSKRRGLPGMSRETSLEPMRTNSPAPATVTSETPSKDSSALRWSSRASDATSTSGQSNQSAGQPDTTPPASDRSSTAESDQSSLQRVPTMSSTQARLNGASERPASPTKGMGGFVQSAMMKRSDSVNKRWSAQPGHSLSRQNSTASVRSGYGGLQGSYSMPKLEPQPSTSRETSNEPSSRPTSSSSNMTATTVGQALRQDDNGFVKPPLPLHSRSKSVASLDTALGDQDPATSPPGSPSKRWSPTKSSWIESALNKPDLPKPSPPKNAQPSWMENIARAKAQRESGEITPRSMTPAPPELDFTRPLSPTKSSTFGPSRSGTPILPGQDSSRPSSPTKAASFGQSLLKRSESRDLRPETGSPRSITPPMKTKPNGLAGRPTSMLAKESLEMAERMAAPTRKEEPNGASKDAAVIAAEPLVASSEKVDPRTIAVATPVAVKTTPPKVSSKPDMTSRFPATNSVKSPPPSTTFSKPLSSPAKDSTPSKPQTDFRATLRSRPAAAPKSTDTPEFLAKASALRPTRPEKYVAPDLLKDNILRGKTGLAVTGGPVKAVRRDELKDSLLAKKDEWQAEKEAGVVKEREVKFKPSTPEKPEALAKRELLTRKASDRTVERSPVKKQAETPEALRRQKSIREQPRATQPEIKPQGVVPEAQQVSPIARSRSPFSTPAPSQTSELAARFNPGLARILALGPPSPKASPSGSRSGSPVQSMKSPPVEATLEAVTPAAPLQDMRKDRAKGPKRRKGASAAAASAEKASDFPSAVQETVPSGAATEVEPARISKVVLPSAKPGSMASIMASSLSASKRSEMGTTPSEVSLMPAKITDAPPAKPMPSPKPTFSPFQAARPPPPEKDVPFTTSTDVKDAASPIKPTPAGTRTMQTGSPFAKRTQPLPSAVAEAPPATPKKDAVPEFRGFATSRVANNAEENKENADVWPPSVKAVSSFWGRSPAAAKPAERPSQIQLPNRRDEEAAMRSAGLLASSPARSNSRPGSSNGADAAPGALGGPPRPAKSSRSDTGRLLADTFGCIPTSSTSLTIDVKAFLHSTATSPPRIKILRKAVQLVLLDGQLTHLAQQDEYTLFSGSVYIITHTYIPTSGPKATRVYIWHGLGASSSLLSAAETTARVAVKREGAQVPTSIRQGLEPAELLEALGGILVTRRGTRDTAGKQYMLCGRQHLGHVVFDEVDFDARSLCEGFVYLISYPVTLQRCKLWLWKGQHATTEEVSAGRLLGMEIGAGVEEVVEVVQGSEQSDFVAMFGPDATSPKPSSFWQSKDGNSQPRLIRIQQLQPKSSFLGAVYSLTRRPSWSSRPSFAADDIKCEAVEMTPSTQTSLEAEGIYILTTPAKVYILVGPLFASTRPLDTRNAVLAQTLLFAEKYAEHDGNKGVEVVFSGSPEVVEGCFRFWDGKRGLWGVEGMMGGSQSSMDGGAKTTSLAEVKALICR